MIRFLYRCLIRAYPQAFRARFEEEMLLGFDDTLATHGTLRLFVDAIGGLVRQWAVQPSPVVPTPVSGPVFYVYEPKPLPSSAVLMGGMAAAILLGAVQFSVNHWSSFRFPVGTFRGTFQPNVLGIGMDRGQSGTLAVGVGPMEDLWVTSTRKYMEALPVLRNLDRNGDGHLSQVEIQRAPEALRRLDRDGDGSLTAEECGEFKGRVPADGGVYFMKAHPVHRALDFNANARIDAEELRGAAVLLRALDLSRDGVLHPAELVPDETVRAVVGRLQ